MLRVRLASLALAGTLLVSGGCSTSNSCEGGGFLNRSGRCSWFGGGSPGVTGAPVSGYVGGGVSGGYGVGGDCECANGGVGGSTNFHEGTIVVPQAGIAPGPMPTPISGTQQPPLNGQAPRIITMPNAPATPYNP